MDFVAKQTIDTLLFEGNEVKNRNIAYTYLPTYLQFVNIVPYEKIRYAMPLQYWASLA